ncbi:MAG: bifunctional (p)ppGpp synthetase/guanosine-3',5'-bis(diphosphate) 3'-pyrophosphohydrolase [Caldisericum sp.]|nr:bifunctional (p)ppGpp synthetase/guanosine-3',5'-bis(diphosphate) 3'-pyrophosphohydrolase [Caldisericum sp.]
MTKESLFEELKNKVSPYLDGEGMQLLEKAYKFAEEKHSAQTRESGEEYIIHPLNVALILANLKLDAETYAAALLHDVVEDTGVTIDEIKENFGETVAFLVNGVTKLKGIKSVSTEEAHLESLRKMLLAMAQDVRVVLIKLADRLHNMRTLNYLPPEKQKEIARETMDIYVPLAHRLGMYTIKWELEDLSFRYLEPEKYYELAKKVAKKREEREAYVNELMEELRNLLKEHGISGVVEGRPKNLYGIYRKMIRDGKQFEEIYDIIALRIIVDDIPTCYQVLGIVNNYYKLVPGRIKDYIAMPKPNNYRSLHTTVITKSGEPFEIQIRTREMHEVDEIGIAAHWKYKEGKSLDKNYEAKIAWLRQMLEWQKEVRSSKEFVERVKVDLFTDEVLVFTPKGDVIELPQGSTPVDFAFRVHTDIGYRCIGAKVNGTMVPLDYKLQTGDRVEIITSKTSTGPKLDWLQFVRTASAKSKIKAYFRKLYEEKKEQEKVEETPKVQLPKIIPLKPKTEVSEYFPAINGASNINISIAKCCNPKPFDEIVGYVSRGRGIKVHRVDCPNLIKIIENGGKIVEAHWSKGKEKNLYAFFKLTVQDVPGLIYKISGVFAKRNISFENFHSSSKKKKFKGKLLAYVRFSCKLDPKVNLSDLVHELESLEEVVKVRVSKRWVYEGSSPESEDIESESE